MNIRDRIKELRRVRAGDLRPHPKNWRTHPEAQQNALRGILAEVGWVDALMVRELPDGSLQIVDGHLRAETTPDAEVPVLVVDLTDAEADKVLATFDPLGAMAEPDEAQLAALLAGITTDSEALAALLEQLADDAAKGQAGEVTEDDIPEPPDEAITQPGELIILGDHRLLCGDSSKPEDVDRLLGGAKIHLVNTDPPYNVRVEPRSNNAIAAGLSSFTSTHHQGLDVARHPGKAKATGKKLRAKDRPLANDFVSEEEFDRLLAAWFGNMSRVLLPGRSFYIWGGYANLGNYPPFLKKHDLYFSQGIVWDKQHPVLTRKDFLGAFELAFYGWKSGAGHKFFGPNNVPDLWQVKKVTPQKMVHLCLHPDALVLTESGYRAISTISAGDRVLSGDGTFHRASHVSSHPYISSHLYRIRAKGGNATTDASDNHPLLIWRPQRRGEQVAWVRADEVRPGDYTMTPIMQEPRSAPFPECDEECPMQVEHEGHTYSLRQVRSVERIPYAGDVWNLSVEGHPSFQTAVGLSHNTEKPVELAARAIQYSSRKGENVLDLFGGSGSTLIAAEQTGRKAFLMELDALYVDVIIARWENLTGKKAERRPASEA